MGGGSDCAGGGGADGHHFFVGAGIRVVVEGMGRRRRFPSIREGAYRKDILPTWGLVVEQTGCGTACPWRYRAGVGGGWCWGRAISVRRAGTHCVPAMGERGAVAELGEI